MHGPFVECKITSDRGCGFRIVVFELWNSFDTEMERFVTLKELREKSKLPEHFAKAHPEVGQFVAWLLNADPAARPTARRTTCGRRSWATAPSIRRKKGCGSCSRRIYKSPAAILL